MHHGKVKFAKGQEQTILNAVATTNASTPNDQLVAEGRKVFRDPSLFRTASPARPATPRVRPAPTSAR